MVKEFCHKDITYKRCRNLNIHYAKYCLLNDFKNGGLRYPIIIKKNFEIKTFFKTKIVYSKK